MSPSTSTVRTKWFFLAFLLLVVVLTLIDSSRAEDRDHSQRKINCVLCRGKVACSGGNATYYRDNAECPTIPPGNMMHCATIHDLDDGSIKEKRCIPLGENVGDSCYDDQEKKEKTCYCIESLCNGAMAIMMSARIPVWTWTGTVSAVAVAMALALI